MYHGSTKKVEEYFAGLGIVVPERVTPPDHYIDILEGIIKSGSNVTREQLPVRWMLHNGYPVPQDMLHLCDEISNSSSPDSSIKTVDKRQEKSFIRDLIQEIKCALVLRREHIMHNFLTKQDLSNRITPGIMRQYRYFLGRYVLLYCLIQFLYVKINNVNLKVMNKFTLPKKIKEYSCFCK